MRRSPLPWCISLALLVLLTWTLPGRTQTLQGPPPVVFIPGFAGTMMVKEHIGLAMADFKPAELVRGTHGSNRPERMIERDWPPFETLGAVPTETPAIDMRLQDLADDHDSRRFSLELFEDQEMADLSYRPLLTFLQVDAHYTLGKNLFIFPYDWRQSNLQTANHLADAIHEWQKSVGDRKFVLIGHSEGALVARYYVNHMTQDLHQPVPVSDIIAVGAPFKGSALALRAALEGKVEDAGTFHSLGSLNVQNQVRELLLSSPSIYEMSSTDNDGYPVLEVKGMPAPLVAMQHPEVLRALFKAPAEFKGAPDYTGFLNDVTRDAQQFQRCYERPMPDGIRMDYVYCDTIVTDAILKVDPNGRTLEAGPSGIKHTFYHTAAVGVPGDGTVPALSARPNWTEADAHECKVLDYRHGELTRSRTVQEYIKDVLALLASRGS